MQSRYISWPNGKKIAIAITVMFEVWPDGKGPPNLVQRTQVAAVLDKLLGYFAQFPDVWFARHRELAQWALDSEFDEINYARRFFAT